MSLLLIHVTRLILAEYLPPSFSGLRSPISSRIGLTIRINKAYSLTKMTQAFISARRNALVLIVVSASPLFILVF